MPNVDKVQQVRRLGLGAGQTSQTLLMVLNFQGVGTERSEEVSFEELNESEPFDEGS